MFRRYPARPAQYTVAIHSKISSFLYFTLEPPHVLPLLFLLYAIPAQTLKRHQMATAEPDKILDRTVPTPNPAVAPVAPPEPSLAKLTDAAPNGTPAQPTIVVPQVNVNGEPLRSPGLSGTFAPSFDPDSSTWGANFWVTLVDPQVRRVLSSASSRTTIIAVSSSSRPAPRSLHAQRRVRLVGTLQWAPLCESYCSKFQILLLSFISVCLPATMASGGSLVMNLAGEYHIIIKLKQGRPSGSAQMDSLFP